MNADGTGNFNLNFEGLTLAQELIEQFNNELGEYLNGRESVSKGEKSNSNRISIMSILPLNKFSSAISKLKNELSKSEKMIETLRNEDLIFNLIKQISEYNPIKKINQSRHSSLYTVSLPVDEKIIYLMKVYDNTRIDNDIIIRERRAHIHLKNTKYTVKYITSGELNKQFCYLVFEYIKGPDLKSLLTDGNLKINLDEDLIFFFFIQIYYSICELHFNGIIHRNLQLQNFLFDEFTNQIKITDFTSVLFFDDEPNRLSDKIINEYICPEGLLKKLRPTNIKDCARYDVFSLGIIFYFLIFRKFPYKIDFSTNSEEWAEERLTNIFSKIKEELDNSLISQSMKDLLKSMLEFKNDERIKLSEIQHSQYFTESKSKLKIYMSEVYNFTEVYKKILRIKEIN